MDMRIDSIDSMDSVPEFVSDTFANNDVISTLVSRLNITHPAVDVSDLICFTDVLEIVGFKCWAEIIILP